MSDIYYSTDEEIFNHAEIRDAADDLFSNDEAKPGDTGIIYSGEPVRFQASDFVSNLIDSMRDRAYDEAGEHADGYLSTTDAQEKELDLLVGDVVNAWADRNKLGANFYKVKNVKEIKVEMLDDEMDFYRVIEGS